MQRPLETRYEEYQEKIQKEEHKDDQKDEQVVDLAVVVVKGVMSSCPVFNFLPPIISRLQRNLKLSGVYLAFMVQKKLLNIFKACKNTKEHVYNKSFKVSRNTALSFPCKCIMSKLVTVLNLH